MLIDGIHVPLTVPFSRDGRVFHRKLESNVARYSLGPAAGLVALGPGSEARGLSDDETREVLDTVARSAAPEKVLVAGVAKDSVAGALMVAEWAYASGFDGLMLAAPTAWPELSRGELLLFFQAVADASLLPVMLWSNGAAPGMRLPIDLIAELARHGNVIGLYDAELTLERRATIADATRKVRREVAVTTVFAPVTRRMARLGEAGFVPVESLGGGVMIAAKPAVKMRVKTVGLQVMAAGDCGSLLPLLEAGVAGALPRLAACAPQACYEVYAAFKDGDPGLSAEKAVRVFEADAAMRELGVAGVKYGCDLNGYFGGLPRLPRVALDAAQRLNVEGVLREVRN